MPLNRRSLLTIAIAGGLLPAIARAEDETRAERAVGKPDAKITVNEYFSLTCTHCAAFAKETMPQVHKELVEPGIVRWVYHDYPLDQVALTAAMVARHLPVDRYEPFVNALFASQDRWAFSRGSNPTDELWKMAALAGMSRGTFDKAIGDTGLRDWIIAQQKADTEHWKIDSTPSFVINNKKYAGEMSYDAFRKLIPA
ncbi:MAG TPA: thioredoxin domain-containing protein [Crenalkalicoccus sp.]|jgi:protein-disulfide isomerase|nr:thioredoxin domain-containing protein [Crenalkalicoccus sp.]